MGAFSNIFAVAVYLIFFLSAGYSQIKIQRNLTVEDGLVQSQVISIYEDSDGFMWFGTYDGISRWDGLEFVNFQSQNGVVGAEVYHIREHPLGIIQFKTPGGILNEYQANRIQALHESAGLERSQVTASWRSRDGKVFFGIKNEGVRVLNESIPDVFSQQSNLHSVTVRSIFESAAGSLFFITDSSGVFSYDNGEIQYFNAENGLSSNDVYFILERKNGSLLFCTWEDGVNLYENGAFRQLTTKEGLVDNQIIDIYESKDSTLYFVSENKGVSIYKNRQIKTLNTRKGLVSNNVIAIHEGPDSTMYFGTYGAGVSVYKNGVFEVIQKKNGLADDFVHDITSGKNGIIYFGTDDGVSLYKPMAIVNYNEATGLQNNYVTSIQEGLDGEFYFGTFGEGLSIYRNGSFQTLREKDGLISNYVYSLFQDEDGALYIGTWGGGMSIYKNGSFQNFTVKDGLAEDRVLDIHKSHDGIVYFATGGGISTLKNGRFQNLTEENGLPCEHVVCIYEGADSTLYFGSEHGGVTTLKNGKIDKIPGTENLAENIVLSIYQDSEGALYFATHGSGISILKNGAYSTIDVRSGLSNNTVQGILEDHLGNIYLTTNKGVNILDLSGHTPKIRVLRSSDGLASDETNQGAYFKDSQGQLWFGTVRGVTCYDPRMDVPDITLPRVYISRMRIFEDEVALNERPEIPLKHNENYLKFDFIGIDLNAPKKIVYRYRLTGVDKEWVETDQRFVQYTNLDNGRYTFEVKAKNQWEMWSHPATIAIRIAPPFWETWWFILLIILVLGGTGVILVTNRVQQLLAIERIRSKLAADLHDNIGSSLTEISIISEVVAKQISNEPEERVLKNLEKISGISRTVIDNMNDIVWLVNPKRDSLHDLVIHLRDLYTELFSFSGIIFKTINLQELEKIRLPMTYRQNLYLIFKEALHNSLKHSQCREILLETEIVGRRLNMALKDDGIGFDLSQRHSGNGLENMMKRAETIGGNLRIESRRDTVGTIIQFSGKLI